MKKNILFAFVFLLHFQISAQGLSLSPSFSLPKDKGKPVKYNAFGVGLYPNEQQMFGGNHVSYRKFGFGLSWRVSFQNIQFNRNYEENHPITIDTAIANGWLTGNSKNFYSFSGNVNVVFPLTKKIPVYFGIGAVRKRHFVEVQAPFAAPGDTDWLINTDQNQFLLNFGGGIFIPVAGRWVLNLGYDHIPQTIFVGIAISGPFNYEDLDMW